MQLGGLLDKLELDLKSVPGISMEGMSAAAASTGGSVLDPFVRVIRESMVQWQERGSLQAPSAILDKIARKK